MRITRAKRLTEIKMFSARVGTSVGIMQFLTLLGRSSKITAPLQSPYCGHPNFNQQQRMQAQPDDLKGERQSFILLLVKMLTYCFSTKKLVHKMFYKTSQWFWLPEGSG